MELRQLEYFVAVAEEANFTRAAERVHISQSGVSAQIRQLERDLGAILLDRSGRTATLTAAGAALLPHARTALASAEAARHAVDDVNGLVRGRLVVGMVNGCTVTPLFDALAAFHRAYPGIELSLYEANSDLLVDNVRTGSTDLALIGAAGAAPAGVGAFAVVTEPLVAAVAADHPLASRAEVALADAIAYPVVCLPEGTGIRAAFDQACTASGLKPDIALQASAPGAVADLAARGLGVAILSDSMVDEGLLTKVRLTDAGPPAILAVVWSRTPSPALRQLIHLTHQSFGQNSIHVDLRRPDSTENFGTGGCAVTVSER